MKLATDKQIAYLAYLAKKVERMKGTTPSLKQLNQPYIDWEDESRNGMTVEDASVRIDAYKTVIRWANFQRMICGLKQM